MTACMDPITIAHVELVLTEHQNARPPGTPLLPVLAAVSKEASALEREPLALFHCLDDEVACSAIQDGRSARWRIVFARDADPAACTRWLSAFADVLRTQPFGLTLVDRSELRFEHHDLQPDLAPPDEVALQLCTPCDYNARVGVSTLRARELVRLVDNRMQLLFQRSTGIAAEQLSLLPLAFDFIKITYSGSEKWLKGRVGWLYLRGPALGALLPWLRLVERVHLGRNARLGQGQVRLHAPAPPFFDPSLVDAGALLRSLQDISETHDEAGAALAERFSMPGASASDWISVAIHDVQAGRYSASPSSVFTIGKPGGGEREIERPHPLDLLWGHRATELLTPHWDRLFEPGSLGFRPGRSIRQAAREIEDALASGYAYVLESDIADFFPSIDHGRMASLIDAALPRADTGMRGLLSTLLRSPRLHRGVVEPRQRGLVQGSPLSPLLSNLYLDAVDENWQARGLRWLRYADDFILFAHDRAEAERLLDDTEAALSGIGLQLKHEKTAIRPVADGFDFLGQHFGSERLPDAQSPLAKPLYVVEPYAQLGLHGDALEIRKNRTLLRTLPMRRVSEILLLAPANVSTALMHVAQARQIAIVLAAGRRSHALLPADRRFFDVCAQQSRRMQALSDAERLNIAREIVLAKLVGYKTLLRRRYQPGFNRLALDLDRALAAAGEASTLDQLRGVEGSAARKTYQCLNALLVDERWHIQRRDRLMPDPINAVLNFTAFLTYSRINVEARAAGLNPYLGFLHDTSEPYEQLVADIHELFRARTEAWLVKVLNLRVITPEQFENTDRGLRLNADAQRSFVVQFERELLRVPRDGTLPMGAAIRAQIGVLVGHLCHDRSLSFYRWGEP